MISSIQSILQRSNEANSDFFIGAIWIFQITLAQAQCPEFRNETEVISGTCLLVNRTQLCNCTIIVEGSFQLENSSLLINRTSPQNISEIKILEGARMILRNSSISSSSSYSYKIVVFGEFSSLNSSISWLWGDPEVYPFIGGIQVFGGLLEVIDTKISRCDTHGIFGVDANQISARNLSISNCNLSGIFLERSKFAISANISNSEIGLWIANSSGNASLNLSKLKYGLISNSSKINLSAQIWETEVSILSKSSSNSYTSRIQDGNLILEDSKDEFLDSWIASNVSLKDSEIWGVNSSLGNLSLDNSSLKLINSSHGNYSLIKSEIKHLWRLELWIRERWVDGPGVFNAQIQLDSNLQSKMGITDPWGFYGDFLVQRLINSSGDHLSGNYTIHVSKLGYGNSSIIYPYRNWNITLVLVTPNQTCGAPMITHWRILDLSCQDGSIQLNGDLIIYKKLELSNISLELPGAYNITLHPGAWINLSNSIIHGQGISIIIHGGMNSSNSTIHGMRSPILVRDGEILLENSRMGDSRIGLIRLVNSSFKIISSEFSLGNLSSGISIQDSRGGLIQDSNFSSESPAHYIYIEGDDLQEFNHTIIENTGNGVEIGYFFNSSIHLQNSSFSQLIIAFSSFKISGLKAESLISVNSSLDLQGFQIEGLGIQLMHSLVNLTQGSILDSKLGLNSSFSKLTLKSVDFRGNDLDLMLRSSGLNDSWIENVNISGDSIWINSTWITSSRIHAQLLILSNSSLDSSSISSAQIQASSISIGNSSLDGDSLLISGSGEVNSSELHLNSIQIQGSGISINTSWIHGGKWLEISNSSGVNIHGNRIWDLSWGIWISNSSNISFSSNSIEHLGSLALEDVAHSEFSNNTLDGVSVGFDIYNCSKLSLINNTIGAQTGILLRNSSWIQIQGNKFNQTLRAIRIHGQMKQHFEHIIQDNWVDSRPIGYIFNTSLELLEIEYGELIAAYSQLKLSSSQISPDSLISIDSELELDNLTIKSRDSGIHSLRSRLKLNSSDISGWIGIHSQDSALDIHSSWIRDSGYGILSQNSSLILDSSSILNNSLGIYLLNSRGNISFNSIQQSQYGIWYRESDLLISNSNKIQAEYIGIWIYSGSNLSSRGDMIDSNHFGMLIQGRRDHPWFNLSLANPRINSSIGISMSFGSNFDLDWAWIKSDVKGITGYHSTNLSIGNSWISSSGIGIQLEGCEARIVDSSIISELGVLLESSGKSLIDNLSLRGLRGIRIKGECLQDYGVKIRNSSLNGNPILYIFNNTLDSQSISQIRDLKLGQLGIACSRDLLLENLSAQLVYLDHDLNLSIERMEIRDGYGLIGYGLNQTRIGSYLGINNSYGIYLERSFNNSIQGKLQGNGINLWVDGIHKHEFQHHLDLIINGRQALYLFNTSDLKISASTSHATIAYSTNLSLELELIHGDFLRSVSSQISILNSNLSNNLYGIHARDSLVKLENSIISGNQFGFVSHNSSIWVNLSHICWNSNLGEAYFRDSEFCIRILKAPSGLVNTSSHDFEFLISNLLGRTSCELSKIGYGFQPVEGVNNFRLELSQGWWNWSLRCEDEHGNHAQTPWMDLGIDLEPPRIQLEYPSITPLSRIELKGKIEDGFGIKAAYLDSIPIEMLNGEFRLELRLELGSNRFRIRALDLAGNLAEMEFQILRIAPIFPAPAIPPSPTPIPTPKPMPIPSPPTSIPQFPWKILSTQDQISILILEARPTSYYTLEISHPKIKIQQLRFSPLDYVRNSSLQLRLLDTNLAQVPEGYLVNQYLSLSSGFQIREMILEFWLEREWLRDNNLSEDQVVVLVWEGGWREMPSRKLWGDPLRLHYSVELAQVSDLIQLAISGKIPRISKPEFKWNWIFLTGILAGLGCLIYEFLKRIKT